MAIKVPTYGRQQQQLQGLDTSGADLRITGQDLTGGLGESLGQASDQAADLYSQKLKEANEARVLEATNQLDQAQNELLSEAQQQKGRNATGLTDEYLPLFDERAEKIKQDLGLNEPQKEAFERIKMKRKPRVQQSLMKHQQQEFSQYKEQEFEAYQKNRYQSALENWDDPQAINEDLLGLRQSIRMRAENQGWGEERTNQALEAAGSNVVYGAIERQTANGQADTAAQFLESNRDYLQGDQLVQAEEMVRESTLRTRAQNETDRLLAQGMERQEALDQARQFDDAELRDATVKRLKNRFSEEDAAEERAQEQALEQAEQTVEQNGDVDAVSPSTWNRLSSSQRSSLETRARQVQAGVEPTTDYTTWTNIMDMNTGELAKADPVKMRPRLDDSHYEKFLSMRREARAEQGLAGGDRKAPDTTSTLTFKDRVKQTVRQAGVVDPDTTSKDWNENETERVYRFEQEAARRIEEAEIEKGRKLTGTEMQDVMDQMKAEKVMLDELGPDSERVFAGLSEDDRGRAYVPSDQIPSAERAAVESYIQDQGIEPTQELIERAYVGIVVEDKDMVDQIIAEEAE